MADSSVQELMQVVNDVSNRCSLNEKSIEEMRREHRDETERQRASFSKLEGSVETMSSGQNTIMQAIGEFNGGIKALKWILPLFGGTIVVAVAATVYLITN